MKEIVKIVLQPTGKILHVPWGTPLADVLFAEGVEFPCGGHGLCRSCRVRVLEGVLPATQEQVLLLGTAAVMQGWRLSCQAKAESDLCLELAQWESAILTDETAFPFIPADGLGVAVDLGTTTVVAQLVDLRTAKVLAVSAGLNQQGRHGADIMSRVEFALVGKGQKILESLVREQVGGMIQELLAKAGPQHGELKSVMLAGNTIMHHLFCGVDVEPMSHHPFASVEDGLMTFAPAQLGWSLPGNPRVFFLPCLGGFVGSDLLAGVLAVRLHEKEELCALIDLGTNGEIVLGNRTALLCASTAAGPAFEGSRIGLGMRAATGAIASVTVQKDRLRCHTLGGGEPRGICGSGLVDAVAASLDLGTILPSGRLASGKTLPLDGPVALSQRDIRELQLAKGAIAAGMQILLEEWGAGADEVSQVYLAGAFGNYINRASARRIGLLHFPMEKIVPSGNTALLGAKVALFNPERSRAGYPDLRRMVRHVSLNESQAFQDVFAEEMVFPSFR
jgi:uncharacterized 2Fe-2S/4Fe-4S cluster protein (DUF4445 family)